MAIEWIKQNDEKDLGLKTLKELPHGTPFRLPKAARRIWLKVKPTGFLLNSTLVNDVLNRADGFCISLDQPCTLISMPGDKVVIPVDLAVTDKGDSK